MDVPGLVWLFGGTIAGNVLFSLLGAWYRAILEVTKDGGFRHRWAMVVGVSLFNAGPWALVAAAIFTYYEISAPWAPWFFGGAFVWVMFVLTLASLVAMKRGRQAKSEGPKNVV